MKYFNGFILPFLLCFLFGKINAQQIIPCGSDEINNELLLHNPKLNQVNYDLLLNYKNLQNSREDEFDSVLVIPVVFHILYIGSNENISDAQIFDAMEILNNDFRKLNTDTSDVIIEFKSLIADSKIEFRLATKDPEGNCTNGIEHILTNETWIGDSYSKINQWPPDKYLNIWVVGNIESGVAGYSNYPQYINSLNSYIDGIVIKHDFVGSIGTSIPLHSRVLTHEVGHYLGLPHIWGTGPVEYVCGDDGFDDTPVTKGWYGCPFINFDQCVPGIKENFQNFMDYSYCNKMFTPNQAGFMRYILQSGFANRFNLPDSANLYETGANLTSPPMCSPVAEFKVAGIPIFCLSDSVMFQDLSWGAPIDNYQWSFPTGSPSTSTLQNPRVKFNAPGFHEATLTVSNSAGNHSKTLHQAVWISYPWADNFGPYNEDFEGETADDWRTYNLYRKNINWELVNNAGYNSTHCYKLNYYWGNNPDSFAANKTGGSYNYLFSPVFDLTNTTSVQISFDFSGATNNPDPSDYLEIFIGYGCGRFLYKIGEINGSDLFPGTWNNSDFVPQSSQWAHYSISLNNFWIDNDEAIRFVFGYHADDYTNNFYFDNFNVNGILSTDTENTDFNFVQVFPNPVLQKQDIHLNLPIGEKVKISIFDITGKLIFTQFREQETAEEFILNGDKLNLLAGSYIISINSEKRMYSTRLVVI